MQQQVERKPPPAIRKIDCLEDLQTGNESRDEQEFEADESRDEQESASEAENLEDEEGGDCWEVSKVLLTSLYHSNCFAEQDQ